MLKCKIIFKGQEFPDAKTFADFIKSSGTEAFSEFEAPLAKILAEKYSSEAEDSVAEVMTKLKAERKGKTLDVVTKEDVDEYLYPEGQAQDYVTQSKIHGNTYAGVKATGISANFSKMLAYLFSATPITEITDSLTGESFSVDRDDPDADAMGRTLMKKYKASSIRDLLKKEPKFKISKKGAPSVKERWQPVVNKFKFASMSRNELNYDGTERKLFKNVAGRELLINVFETIDTVINLAIDNVKEQKLFILGLTNSNANALLTAIGFGIPLNDVARIFNSDVVVNVSKGRRLNAQSINAEAMEMLKEASDEDVKKYLLESGQEELLKTVTSRVTNKGISYAQALAPSIHELGIDTAILDKVFIGDPTYKTLSNVAVLANLSKFVSMGDEMFAYSRIFSLLRGLPSKKWAMDTIAKLPLKYAEFKQVEGINKKAKQQTVMQMIKLFKASEEYQQLSPGAQADAITQMEVELGNDDTIYGEELKRRQRSWFLNKVARNDLMRTMTPSSASVFSNVTILSLPHVYSAWRSLLSLIRVIEQTFALHSPRIATLADNIIKKIKSDDAWVKGDFQESIQTNFIKFLTSNLKIQVEGQLQDMAVDPNLYYTNPLGVTFRGEEAWTQKFISELSPLLGSRDNQLLASIEERTDRETGAKQLMITADKVGDDELIEILRRDFLGLQAIDPELPIKLFKYAVMTSGLFYGRTNFSLIFPASYALGFDKALNARLASVLTTSNIKTDINLRVLEDQFLYQFVRNNPASLSYINRLKPIPSARTKVQKGTRRIFHGIDTRPYGNVYYDLKFPNQEGTIFDKVIRRYGKETYIKIENPLETEFVYYRVFSSPSINTAYAFDEADMDVGLDIAKLQQSSLPLITLYQRVNNSTIKVKTSVADYKEGDRIFLNPNLAKLNMLEAYDVVGSTEGRFNGFTQDITYKLTRVKSADIDLTHTTLVNGLKARPYYLEIGSSDVEAMVAINQQQALLQSRRPGTLLVTGNIELAESGVYSLDLTKSINEIVAQIDDMPKSKRYLVDKSIIDTIVREDPAGAIQIATALYTKTNFEHDILGKTLEDVELDLKIERSFKIDDITATSIKVQKTTEVNGLLTAPVSSFERPSAVRVGTLIHLGENSKQQDIFGHVVNVEEGIASLSFLDSAIFDFLTKSNYSVEELETIKKKVNPC